MSYTGLGTTLGTGGLNIVKLGRPLILGWLLEKESTLCVIETPQCWGQDGMTVRKGRDCSPPTPTPGHLILLALPSSERLASSDMCV